MYLNVDTIGLVHNKDSALFGGSMMSLPRTGGKDWVRRWVSPTRVW